MNLLKRSYFLAVTAFLMTGCATTTPSTFQYSEPEAVHSITNEIIVSEDFDTVWNRMVKELSDSFFVINNIDRESRLINLSFSSDDPTDYIDCGSTERTFDFKGKSQTYKYAVAGNNQYKLLRTWNPPVNQPLVAEIRRDSQLDGRINLYVAPVDDSSTEMTVNVRYAYSVNVSGTITRYSAFGDPASAENLRTETTDGPSFNTGQTSTVQWEDGPVTCRAKGTLEKRILSLAQE